MRKLHSERKSTMQPIASKSFTASAQRTVLKMFVLAVFVLAESVDGSFFRRPLQAEVNLEPKKCRGEFHGLPGYNYSWPSLWLALKHVTTDGSLMRKVQGDLNEYVCNSEEYWRMFATLPLVLDEETATPMTPLPPHHLLYELRPIRGTRLLFFGHSFMRQISDAPVVTALMRSQQAYVEQLDYIHNIDFKDSEACLRPHNVSFAVHCIDSQWEPRRNPDSALSAHYVTKALRWTFADLNATMTVVYNHGPLQHRTCEVHLREFLTSFAVDAVAFMEPHDDCFHAYEQARERGQPSGHLRCIDMGGISGVNHGGRDHDVRRSGLRTLFQTYVPVVIEVLPWTVATHAATHFCNSTNLDEVFTSVDITRWPCTVGKELRGTWKDANDCEHHFLGHQCYPSYATVASARVMSALRKSLQRSLHSGSDRRPGHPPRSYPPRRCTTTISTPPTTGNDPSSELHKGPPTGKRVTLHDTIYKYLLLHG